MCEKKVVCKKCAQNVRRTFHVCSKYFWCTKVLKNCAHGNLVCALYRNPVQESFTHEKLLHENGFYRKLFWPLFPRVTKKLFIIKSFAHEILSSDKKYKKVFYCLDNIFGVCLFPTVTVF